MALIFFFFKQKTAYEILSGLVGSEMCIRDSSQTVKSLVEAIEFFKQKQLWRDLKPELIRDWSNSFSQDSFKDKFAKTINRAWREHVNSCDIATSDLTSSS